MSAHLPVLIVGAGPAGLVMACELARRAIPFRIIDKKPERTLTANAVGIQPRTLEMLDNLGLVHQFLKLGHECKALQLHAGGKKVARISMEYLDSNYHFILALPQSETERLLNDFLLELKGEVERARELTAVTQEEQGFSCTVTSVETGQTETILCDWLIACDGANSKVRELNHIPFPGEDLSEQFMVANAEMGSFLPNSEVHLFLNHGTMLATIPFGSNHYRIGVNLHQSPRKFLTEKEVKEMIQQRSQGDYDVHSVAWISPFWIHSKIVKKLRYGATFLAGDAAHIHSPAGAQGMNTGMQDAYNLAWKLALVIQGKARPELLESYQEERYPILLQIVKRAEKATRMATLENPLLCTLRNFMFKLLTRRPGLVKKISMQITQLGLSYKKSSAIDYGDKIDRKAPQPGERVPDVYLNQSTRLHVLLRHTQHKALLFVGPKATESDFLKIKALQEFLLQRYPETIKPFIVAETKWPNAENLILDERNAIHQRYRVTTSAIYLIRPDNYIAYCSKTPDPEKLQKALSRYLT